MATVIFHQDSDMTAIPTSIPSGQWGIAGTTSEIDVFNTSIMYGIYVTGSFTNGFAPASGTANHIFYDDNDYGHFPDIEISGFSVSLTTAQYQSLYDGNLLGFIARVLGGSDVIYGSPGNDKLMGFEGADLLIGGLGGDLLDGGNGNDTASYANASAFVFAGLEEAVYNVGEAKGDTYDSIENLIGSAFNDFLYGSYGQNHLTGLAGNDTLVGKGAADVLDGGVGSDTVSFDSSGAVRADLLVSSNNTGDAKGDVYISIENLAGSSASDILLGDNSANVLSGNFYPNSADGNDQLFGRGGNDTLRGNFGNDRLDGGAGNDVLTGAAGSDSFVFSATLGTATNRDLVTDFSHADDTFVLENAYMTRLAPTSSLNPLFLRLGTQALDGNDYIIYNKATGALFYDSDGNGAAAAIQFAILGNKAAIAANDFQVI